MYKKNRLTAILKTALVDFKRNKVRTFLTSLGITIGVLSVLLLIAMGIGLRNYITQQFEGLGSNLLIVLPGSGIGSGDISSFSTGLLAGTSFDEKDYKSLRRINEIESIAPASLSSLLVEHKGRQELTSIRGTTEEIFDILNWKPIEGETMTRSDVSRKAKVVFIGINTANDLFGDYKEAVGKSIKIGDNRFKVIGVGQKNGAPEVDNGAVIPYTTAFATISPDKSFRVLYLRANFEKNIPVVIKKTEDILLERYEKEDFSVNEQSEILSTINQIFSAVNGVLIAIGSISLVVGGIGIMNIMYATVTERTKEVGIRRAVGATRADIMTQFVSEAVLLSVFGGTLGLGIAGAVVVLVQPFFPLGLDIYSIIITLAVSCGIGIFFGVFPARSAAKLPPIEAIRKK